MQRTYGHWIDGIFKPARNSTIRRHSPADGTLVAEFAAGDKHDIDAAVAAARRCFHEQRWAEWPASERSLLLNRWADLIGSHAERLARIESEESGKPIRYARAEVAWSVEMTRFAAALTATFHGEAFTHLGSDRLGLVSHEPIGVVGMIVPWNFPLVCLFQKLPFALAAGCVAVVKPSEMTSGTALEVAALADEAGFPPGAINVVTGTGEAAGEPLVEHADVAMISFTGSTRVGKQIAQQVGARVGRVALELGGKAANIVFADADLEAAADGVLVGAVLNQGEECAAGPRLLVQAEIHDAFLARLTAGAHKIRVGDPLDDRTDVGALISQAHLDRVLGYIETGKTEGARLLCGGTRLAGSGYDAGFFVGTTIFTNVKPSMKVFREEIFGPVLTVTPFRDADEAVALANDTAYGLANGLWTRDVDKVHQVSRRLRSGTVYVNTYLETALQMPFGGYKESGIGRELGIEALREFTETKSVFLKMGPRMPTYRDGP
jgi:betaine-aldehyde dehydrogenase